MATVWKVSSKRYPLQPEGPLSVAGSKVQHEKNENDLEPKMFKLPVLSPTRYDTLQAEITKSNRSIQSTAEEVLSKSPPQTYSCTPKLLELPELPSSQLELDKKQASTLQKVMKILKNSSSMIYEDSINDIPNIRVSIPITYGQKLPEIQVHREKDSESNDKVIYPSEEGFHPRSNSPTYLTLLEAKKRLKCLLKRKNSWSFRTSNGSERFGLSSLEGDEIFRDSDDFLLVQSTKCETAENLPPSPDECCRNLNVTISKVEEKIENFKKRELTSIYAQTKTFKGNKKEDSLPRRNKSLSPRRIQPNVSLDGPRMSGSINPKRGHNRSHSCNCTINEICLHKINFDNLSGWDSSPFTKSDFINSYVKKVKSENNIKNCPELYMDNETTDIGYYSH